tara:strand:+ start:28 stop:432 length:405 start_codon:yes stop_codon:yes gene_type:complete
MTWIPPRTEDIASPLNPFYNLTNSEVQQVNPELSKKLKESKMNRKEHLDLNEAIANVWTGGQQDIQEGEELITEEMLVEELTNDITTVVESIQEEVGFELSEDEINYIVDTLLEAEEEDEDEDEDEDEKKKMMK